MGFESALFLSGNRRKVIYSSTNGVILMTSWVRNSDSEYPEKVQ